MIGKVGKFGQVLTASFANVIIFNYIVTVSNV